jgi:hypothetical protein
VLRISGIWAPTPNCPRDENVYSKGFEVHGVKRMPLNSVQHVHGVARLGGGATL